MILSGTSRSQRSYFEYNDWHKTDILKYYSEVKNMADYKKMYSILFNKITDLIEELQEVQKQTEALYLGSPEPQLIEIYAKNDESGSLEEVSI
jgi:hypothetical protein